MNNVLDNLKILIQTPDLASKKWVYEQYDSMVMNDTIQIGGDAAIVRVHNTNKALALTADCTPRYVEANPFEGAKQAVVETYRNISAVGGKPLAITNCLNFGNPQKPEIMGQIVRAIQGINQACIELDYPVVSGNVSLYNETDGKAIQPTPNIGGVGLLVDLNKRCDTKLKNIGDIVLVIGKSLGHLGCSLFEREVLKTPSNNPPLVDLVTEKKHGEFVRLLIADKNINACHDVSDGGLLVALFEMCHDHFGVKIDLSSINNKVDANQILFGEDQGRYIISISPSKLEQILSLAKKFDIDLFNIGVVINDQIVVGDSAVLLKDLRRLNEAVLPNLFN